MGAYATSEVPYQGDEPRVIFVAEASYDLFDVVGIDAALGRTFLPDEETPGNHRVALLSDGFWRRELGADGNVLGRTIHLAGNAYEVVGVMPADFEFPQPAGVELWVPLAMDRTSRGYLGSHYLEMVGRLGAGISVDAAREEITALLPALQEAADLEPGFDKLAMPATVEPLLHQTTRTSRMPILVLCAASAVLLFLACANVAHLLLAQALRRDREMAIRGALGAGRGRLVAQLLTESACLAVAGGGLGLLLSVWAVDLLRQNLPADTPRVETMAIDGRVLVFGLLATLATAIAFGVLPALSSSRTDLRSAMADGSAGAGAGRRKQRLRWFLVAAETALAVLLTVAAVSTVRSFVALDAEDPGFDPNGVITLRPELVGEGWRDRERLLSFYDQAIETLADDPAVDTAGAIWRLPIAERGAYQILDVEGHDASGDQPDGTIYWRAIAGDYFESMRIPLVAGRSFEPDEDLSKPAVVIVSRSTAETYWPGEDPIGRRLRTNIEGDEWCTVVGIVGDVRHEGIRSGGQLTMYRPLAQSPDWVSRMALVARIQSGHEAGRDPRTISRAAEAALPRLRGALRSLAPEVPIHQVFALEEAVSGSIAREKLTGSVVGVYGTLALLLAAVGIFGLLSYRVGEQRREIGIRMALGARREIILRRVVAEGMQPVVAGAAVGLVAALLGGGLLQSFLYEVQANDPATYLAVAVVLVAVALAACWLPARSAAALQPVSVLREE